MGPTSTQRSSRQPGRPRVLIAGAGVAGLETLLALRALAGDRVDVTVLAPEPGEALWWPPNKLAGRYLSSQVGEAADVMRQDVPRGPYRDGARPRCARRAAGSHRPLGQGREQTECLTRR